MNILITGGAGFIGSEVVRRVIERTDHHVVVVDKLTYAGDLASLSSVAGSSRYRFEQVDICDRAKVEALFGDHRPDAVMHLAAESHVDRSIDGPLPFIDTNIVGTFNLLESARRYLNDGAGRDKPGFRFLHVSTDEVFGDLGQDRPAASESAAYRPSSPYAASKASADHLVRAWHRTFDLPVLVTNCSNNYGPYQHAEKLIPLMTLNALEGRSLPVYGSGSQVRDWLHVTDHARALLTVLESGRVGETYNIGAGNPRRNLDVVKGICAALERLRPDKPAGVGGYEELIESVADRPGHDLRYEIDATRIRTELGWEPLIDFDAGLEDTVRWIAEHREWCVGTRSSAYGRQRLGLASGACDG